MSCRTDGDYDTCGAPRRSLRNLVSSCLVLYVMSDYNSWGFEGEACKGFV